MGNSKSIYYGDCDEGVKSVILSEFIKKYSDKKITGIRYYCFDTYDIKKKDYIYVYTDTTKIVFKNKLELIQLVENVDRPFIIMGELLDDINQIYFVYGSNKNSKML